MEDDLTAGDRFANGRPIEDVAADELHRKASERPACAVRTHHGAHESAGLEDEAFDETASDESRCPGDEDAHAVERRYERAS